jgi:hypothetical protein
MIERATLLDSRMASASNVHSSLSARYRSDLAHRLEEKPRPRLQLLGGLNQLVFSQRLLYPVML